MRGKELMDGKLEVLQEGKPFLEKYVNSSQDIVTSPTPALHKTLQMKRLPTPSFYREKTGSSSFINSILRYQLFNAVIFLHPNTVQCKNTSPGHYSLFTREVGMTFNKLRQVMR